MPELEPESTLQPAPRPLRVVMVLTASTGGIGRHAASLVPRLVALGLEVVVCAPPLTLAAHDLGPRTTTLTTRNLARAVRDADVVHAHGYKAAALALPHARLHRRPLVVTWHNAVLGDGPAARVGRLLQVLVARGSDLVLAASSDLLATALRLGARAAELAPVAAPVLPPAGVTRDGRRAALGLAPEQVLVLTVSRLAPQKNLDLLLDVAGRTRTRAGVAYVLVGGGPLRDALQRRVDDEGLPVTLVGASDDVASWLQAADLAFLPSRWEARALVAQEALLAGVPLVATGVGGVPELVGEAARLVDPDDPDGAAAVVLALADDPAARAALATAGRERAATWPDEDDVAADLAARYRHVVAGRRRRSP